MELCYNEKRKRFSVIKCEFLCYQVHKANKENEDYAMASFQFTRV